MSESLGPWLISNIGLISVIGALILFFSWIVTNTFGQRYSRLKQSVDSAENTFRLYTSLHELRGVLNSVAMETVYAREAAERVSKSANEVESSELASIRRQYSRTLMSAHQIKELMDFASLTLDYSSSVGTVTDTSQKIKAIHEEIYQLYTRVEDLERTVESANGTPSPPLTTLQQAIEAYTSYFTNDALPQVGMFYETIVSLCNNRRKEGRKELAQSKRNATRAANAVLVLYLVGSLLVIGGQYIDKVYKKSVEVAPPPPPTPTTSTLVR